MMTRAFLVAVLLVAAPATALVNPSLQPMHLCGRYDTIEMFAISDIADASRTVTLTAKERLKGAWTAKTVKMEARDESLAEPFSMLLSKDAPLVAFIGKGAGRRQGEEVLFYTTAGRWQKAEIVNREDPGLWRWTEDTKEACFGTFNGRADRLVEMVIDWQKQRYYFPATPFIRFKPDMVVGQLPGPSRGVALYDIDGDGKLDVYACSPDGDRVYMQTGPLKFEDRTAALGLAGLSSPSVSFADVNCDGFADLLAGGVIYLADGKGRFVKTDLLPAVDKGQLKCAVFAEVSGDGCPDVLISTVKGGLRLFLNSGKAPWSFREASDEAGLRTDACGKDATGFVCWGDWNGDGRTDLYYAAGRGLLLVQDAKGRFSPVKTFAGYNFASNEGEEGVAGGGCFAALWRPDRYDVITTSEGGLILLVNENNGIVDLTSEGNEITECTPSMMAVIAEDLNADGLVDLYTVSRRRVANIYHDNRGYGSFMASYKYDHGIFPGQAHNQGAWGAAAGDVDGDGASDLLLGGLDGAVTLMINDSLSLRQAKENPLYHEKIRLQARYLSVALRGRVGVMGAEITLADGEKKVVARRTIGANVATGCRGPDAASIAVLWPGVYQLRVRFSSGREKSMTVDMTEKVHTSMTVSSDN